VTTKNTAASVEPIIKISCAWISSGDLRRAAVVVDTRGDADGEKLRELQRVEKEGFVPPLAQ
jgi:hypothetical protein